MIQKHILKTDLDRISKCCKAKTRMLYSWDARGPMTFTDMMDCYPQCTRCKQLCDTVLRGALREEEKAVIHNSRTK